MIGRDQGLHYGRITQWRGALPGAWHKFQVFLGLRDDEEHADYIDDLPYDDEPSVDPGPPPVSEAPPRIKTLAPDEEPSKGAVVRQMPAPAEKLRVIAPNGFNEAKDIGDHLKRNTPVIINLVEIDQALRRRLVDFSSGLAYALNAKMERVAENVFLITPSDVEVTAEERRRMRERGLFSSGV
jgi:cell division inhibitor SepF